MESVVPWRNAHFLSKQQKVLYEMNLATHWTSSADSRGVPSIRPSCLEFLNAMKVGKAWTE